MITTIDVICYKSKVLKNGENPLMIRVTKDRKRKYLSLGLSINSNYWDFNKNKPKNNCPNLEQLEKIISEKIKVYKDQVIEFKAIDKEFTASTLMEKVVCPTKRKTVNDLFIQQIDKFTQEKRINYALSHKQLYNSLLKFNKHLDIYFQDIDILWLRKYEVFLRNENLSENSIGIRFRTFRAVYNVAIEENIIKMEYYPFNQFKVARLNQKTAKRAITKDDIYKVINYKADDRTPYLKLAVDLFTFSYFMGGINFVDMAYLTDSNIVDNHLIYTRRKTKKLIRLPLQPKAIEIINRNRNEKCLYIFPILNLYHQSMQQQVNRVHKIIGKVNKLLKQIGKELNIPIDLTTYCRRHKQMHCRLLISLLGSINLSIGNDLETSLVLRSA